MKAPSDSPTSAVILGLGRTGLSCARYLAGQGTPVRVLDSRAAPPELEALRRELPDVPVRLGEFAAEWLAGADTLVVSPGIPVAEPAIRDAAARGAAVIGDIELFARAVRAPVVAITGSNGKSTVTTLVGEMARAAGRRVAVGGNLGPPALDLLAGPPAELYVLELSSFQLETTASLRPAAATVLNVSADHLDRYAGLSEYEAAKARIFAGGGVMVLNRDDPRVAAMARPGRRVVGFTLGEPAEGDFGLRERDGKPWLARGAEPLLALPALRIQGLHNAANALAALALGEAVGLEREAMLAALVDFAGLPHRCQRVAERAGVSWYDDSKGTNVGATVAAILGLAAGGRVVLIAGGQGKGQDFAPLRDAVTGRVRAVVLMGRDAPLIERALAGAVPLRRVANMSEAVAAAWALAEPGDAVLLSPACASFDMYSGYEARGRDFVARVNEVLR